MLLFYWLVLGFALLCYLIVMAFMLSQLQSTSGAVDVTKPYPPTQAKCPSGWVYDATADTCSLRFAYQAPTTTAAAASFALAPATASTGAYGATAGALFDPSGGGAALNPAFTAAAVVDGVAGTAAALSGVLATGATNLPGAAGTFAPGTSSTKFQGLQVSFARQDPIFVSGSAGPNNACAYKTWANALQLDWEGVNNYGPCA